MAENIRSVYSGALDIGFKIRFGIGLRIGVKVFFDSLPLLILCVIYRVITVVGFNIMAVADKVIVKPTVFKLCVSVVL